MKILLRFSANLAQGNYKESPCFSLI